MTRTANLPRRAIHNNRQDAERGESKNIQSSETLISGKSLSIRPPTIGTSVCLSFITHHSFGTMHASCVLIGERLYKPILCCAFGMALLPVASTGRAQSAIWSP